MTMFSKLLVCFVCVGELFSLEIQGNRRFPFMDSSCVQSLYIFVTSVKQEFMFLIDAQHAPPRQSTPFLVCVSSTLQLYFLVQIQESLQTCVLCHHCPRLYMLYLFSLMIGVSVSYSGCIQCMVQNVFARPTVLVGLTCTRVCSNVKVSFLVSTVVQLKYGQSIYFVVE